MNLADLQKLQYTLSNLGIIISFSGQFSQGIIEELSEAINNHLENEQISKSNIYNVISIFVEQSQNISHYIKNNVDKAFYETIASSGIVTIGKEEDGYFITSGNLVLHGDISNITEKIEGIKNLDKDQLKKLYKETMKNDVGDGDHGAGLGFIVMARKARLPIAYSIVKWDEHLSFFTIRVMT